MNTNKIEIKTIGELIKTALRVLKRNCRPFHYHRKNQMPSDKQGETRAGEILRRLKLLKEREFVSVPSLVSRLRRQYNDHGEPVETILIFVASNQCTWLVATGDALYCVLDRSNQPDPKVLWRMPKDDIVENGRLKLAIDAFEDPDSTRTGIIVIDGHVARKFTAGLFIKKTITESVKEMFSKVYGAKA